MNYDLSATWILIILALAVWELSWKGFALWRAGRNGHPGWFIATLVINSLGILPIIYLLAHQTSANYRERME